MCSVHFRSFRQFRSLQYAEVEFKAGFDVEAIGEEEEEEERQNGMVRCVTNGGLSHGNPHDNK